MRSVSVNINLPDEFVKSVKPHGDRVTLHTIGRDVITLERKTLERGIAVLDCELNKGGEPESSELFEKTEDKLDSIIDNNKGEKNEPTRSK